MRILLLDNYDSFTFNIVERLRHLGYTNVDRRYNNSITPQEALAYDALILSPGPGTPSEAGNLCAIIEHVYAHRPILGICLGQQAIGEVFGGSLINLEKVYHGVASKVKITKEDSLFNNLPTEFEVGRYHSWVINPDDFPEDLEITSVDENGEIMSIRHKTFDVKGVQYHPESILTPNGKKILENWLES